jgi:ribonuclease BN (tRNA processing enzyme)
MSENILIRAYKTGCGDCILVKIPDVERDFHILIDCGNFFSQKIAGVRSAVKNIHALLNEDTIPDEHKGKLDLIVATHQHWDHIKGFESELQKFYEIEVKRVWLPIAMKEDHPQNTNLQLLHKHIDTTIEKFTTAEGISLNPGLHKLLMMMSLSRKEATKALVDEIPRHNNISPIYIYRGFKNHLTDEEKNTYLMDFKNKKTEIIVLAPEKDTDEAYVGEVESLIHEIRDSESFFSELVSGGTSTETPINLSMRDFRNLKNNIIYTTLRFS